MPNVRLQFSLQKLQLPFSAFQTVDSQYMYVSCAYSFDEK